MSALPKTQHLHYLLRLRKYLEEGTERVNQRETREKSCEISRAWHSSLACSHSSGSWLYWACTRWSCQQSISRNLGGATDPTPPGQRLFSVVCSMGSPSGSKGQFQMCKSHKKSWLKLLGHKTKRHKYGLQGGVGRHGCIGIKVWG